MSWNYPDRQVHSLCIKNYITMKKIALFILAQPIVGFALFAGNNKNYPVNTETVHGWMNNNSFGFIENKGQIVDQNGNHNYNVLFMNLSPGLKVQLRQQGFSYECFRGNRTVSDEKNSCLKNNPLNKRLKRFEEKNTIQTQRIDIELENSNPHATITGEEPAKDYINYYTQGTSKEGITYVRHYRKITYHNIYASIDLEFIKAEPGKTKNTSGIEYNFIIHPGGNPNDIHLRYNGSNEITLADGNKIKIKTNLGELEEHIPYSFQPAEKTNGGEKPVAVNYEKEENVFSFNVGRYDKNKELIIDPTPTLLWGTFYGGSGEDEIYSVKTMGTFQASNANNVVVGGMSWSPNNIASPGAEQTYYAFGSAFIAVFSSDGQQRLWSTYYGVSNPYMMDICTDNNNNVLMLGYDINRNRPDLGATITTPGSYLDFFANDGSSKNFIVKFNSDGIRDWGTFTSTPIMTLGIGGITTDANGDVYSTEMNDGSNSSFVQKLSSDGTTLLWSFQLDGARGYKIALDASNNVVITGYTDNSPTDNIATPGAFQTVYGGNGIYSGDAFIAKIKNDGSQVLWGSYFGGTGGQVGYDIVVDGNDDMIITGATEGNIATVNSHQPTYGGGIYDGFVAKVKGDGSQLLWSTYYGGRFDDACYGIARDNSNNVYVIGQGFAGGDTIATAGAYNTSSGNFIAEFNSMGQRQWGTYIDIGNKDLWIPTMDITIDNNSDIVVAGIGSGNDLLFPYQGSAGGSFDAFISKFHNGVIVSSIPDTSGNQTMVSVYPNPSNGMITIQVTNSGKVEISVINSTGQLVYDEHIAAKLSENKQIDLTQQPKGIYFMKIKTDKEIINKKIVVQ